LAVWFAGARNGHRVHAAYSRRSPSRQGKDDDPRTLGCCTNSKGYIDA
jgi:hypothetical protein